MRDMRYPEPPLPTAGLAQSPLLHPREHDTVPSSILPPPCRLPEALLLSTVVNRGPQPRHPAHHSNPAILQALHILLGAGGPALGEEGARWLWAEEARDGVLATDAALEVPQGEAHGDLLVLAERMYVSCTAY